MRNINFPFERRPASTGMAQRGLASIPRYAEGAEEEIEEKEESTLDQIISYLLEYSGILPEGLSLQGLLGNEEGMAHGGIVPGTNPIQGEKGGPTLGYEAPIDRMKIQRNQRLFDEVLGDQYDDIRHLNVSRGYNVLGGLGSPNFSDNLWAERYRLDKAARAAPAPEQSTYIPTGAQTFDDLAVAPKVIDPTGSYVTGGPSREQLYAQYFPDISAPVQVDLGLMDPKTPASQTLQQIKMPGINMAHGGVVPGTNPVQGQKDGPTVGFNAPQLSTQQKNMMYFAQSRVDLGLMDRKTANNIIYGPGGIRSGPEMRAQINAGLIRKQTAPAQQESTYTPTGPQSFGDLQTASKVEDPIGSYVVGSPSREELLAQYFPPDSSSVQHQRATGSLPLTKEQLLGLAGLV